MLFRSQIIFDESFEERLKEVKNEYILQVKGSVIERSSKNPKMATGDIEVQAKDFQIINTAKLTPMIVADETDALEETRMQYRYLDLRRPIYKQTAAYGHFGRTDLNLPWEQLNKVEEIKKLL